jgi:hypothetical protein
MLMILHTKTVVKAVSTNTLKEYPSLSRRRNKAENNITRRRDDGIALMIKLKS